MSPWPVESEDKNPTHGGGGVCLFVSHTHFCVKSPHRPSLVENVSGVLCILQESCIRVVCYTSGHRACKMSIVDILT